MILKINVYNANYLIKSRKWLHRKIKTKHVTDKSNVVSCLTFSSGFCVDYFLKKVAGPL